MESTNNQTPARSSEEQLKAKYGGKLYRVGITVPVDDESEKEFSYYFKRPTVPSYDRYIKTAAQGITKASKASLSTSHPYVPPATVTTLPSDRV